MSFKKCIVEFILVFVGEKIHTDDAKVSKTHKTPRIKCDTLAVKRLNL